MYVITSVATLHRFKILIATKLKKIDDTRNSINPTQFVWFELVLLDDESPSAYLGNVHGFINKQYYLYCYKAFWKTQSKATRAYAQSRQYHTIVESRVRLTWYQSHALNLVVPIDW